MKFGRNKVPIGFAIDEQFAEEVVESLISLMLTTRKWVYRRTDRVDFLDTTTTENEAQFEFELPEWVSATNYKEQQVFLVPLGIFKRDIPLRGLEIKDEEGTRLSTLTRFENSKLITAVLDRLMSEAGLSSQFSDTQGELLETISFRSRRGSDSDEFSLSPLTEAWKTELTRALDEVDQLLRLEDKNQDTLAIAAIRTIICDIWMGYPNIVALPPSNHPRRVVTMKHEERLITPKEARRKDSRGISGSVMGLEFGSVEEITRVTGVGLPSGLDKSSEDGARRGALSGLVGAARSLMARYLEPMWIHVIWGQWFGSDYESNHLEVKVPDELSIDQAFLYWQDWEFGQEEPTWKLSTSTDTGLRAHLIRSEFDWKLTPLGAPSEGERETEGDDIVARDGKTFRVRPPERRSFEDGKVWAEGQALKPSSRGLLSIVSVLISARAKTMRSSAFGLSFVSIGLLAACFQVAQKLSARPEFGSSASVSIDAFVTLLVIVPTVGAAIATQPTSHEISSALVRPLRELITLLGTLPVIAAVALVLLDTGSIPLEAVNAVLIILLVASLLVLGCLGAQARSVKKSAGEPLLRAYPQGNVNQYREEDYSRAGDVQREMTSFPSEVHMVQSVEGLRYAAAVVTDGEEPLSDQKILDASSKFIPD